MKEQLIDQDYMLLYVRYTLKWLVLSVVIGILCGLLGALFYNGVVFATNAREQYPFILYALPFAGLFIVFLYKRLHISGVGTDHIVESAREGTPLPLRLVPAIFIGTILTHLCGGSAGREGAALQIGGGIGNNVGKLFRLTEEDLKIATMAGMAAVFSALFGTPITATVFVASFLVVGHVYTAMYFPGFISAISAYAIARYFGMVPFAAKLVQPELDIVIFLKVMLLALIGAMVSALFVKTLHFTGEMYKRYLKNEYLRVVVGAGLIIALTLLLGTRDYNGAGGSVIGRALTEGQAVPYAFLLKILFTALTLEAGFKGGEIVPSFFIGSTFGAFFGSLLGISPQFGAAIGLVVVFGGATNTLIAPIFLAIEAFGAGEGTVYFTMAAIISFMMSGYNGLYSKQTIRYSKLRARLVNIQTNHKPDVLKQVVFDRTGVHRKND